MVLQGIHIPVFIGASLSFSGLIFDIQLAKLIGILILQILK